MEPKPDAPRMASPARESVGPPVELSQTTRLLLVGAGALALFLGAAGAILPLLPTTPFVLVAAACFARSSPSFHRALRDSRLFGALLREWEDHRSIPRRAKTRALIIIVLVFAASMTWAIESTGPRLAMGVGGLVLVVFLARLPVTRGQ